MVRNYLTIALRNLIKYRLYSLINIVGLSVGQACCILIVLFVQDEMSYDRHHANADRIYRVTREFFTEAGSTALHLASVAPPIAPLLRNDFPELRVIQFWGSHPMIGYGEKEFLEERFIYADADVFEIFTFPREG